MNLRDEPLVSVLTPVYNGESFLAECIESVLAGTYSNWEYHIINNASTDGTLAIAERYARADKRIRVHHNEQLVDIIANHNRAFRLISPDAKYCKVVSADDWLFPDCIARMVDLAESNPSVGIVGSYQLSGSGTDWRGWRVRWAGLPYPSPVISGREICRLWFLAGIYAFGTPTSTLYRADLIREQDSFYPNSTAEADTSACVKYLGVSDFGFVHQVLSYERVHPYRMTTTSGELNAYLLSRIADLKEYGPLHLTETELHWCVKNHLDQYYAFLAKSAIRFRKKSFWTYHKKRLKELGYPLDHLRLARATSAKMIDLLLNPKHTVETILMHQEWAIKMVRQITKSPEDMEAQFHLGQIAKQ